MKYTDRIMSIVTDALSRMEQITGQIEELDRRFKAEEIAGVDYQAQKAELLKQRDAARMEATKLLRDTGEAYREAVEKGSEIDSSMLHDDAKLLQISGLNMTDKQFAALVEKHKDNTLMIQLLQGYSERHTGLYAGSLPTVAARIAAFSGFVEAAQNTLRTPDSMQAAFFQDGRYTPQICTENE